MCISEIAQVLKEQYSYTFLSQYIEKLCDKEIVNFTAWFETQINIPQELSNEDYLNIIHMLDTQTHFLSIANWNWNTSDDPCENVKLLKKCSSIFNQRTIRNISMFCVCAVFLYIFSVTFLNGYIDEDNRRFVDQSLGNLYGILNTIIGFYCGGAYHTALSSLEQDDSSPKLRRVVRNNKKEE